MGLEYNGKSEFDGGLGERIVVIILSAFLTFITLGIGYSWLFVWKKDT